MKGKSSIFDENREDAQVFAHEVYLNTVWTRNPLESAGFARFWLLIEQEWVKEDRYCGF